MAKLVEKITLGIDVSSHEDVVHHWETGHTLTIPHEDEAIEAFFQSLQGTGRIAIEPTSNYHMPWVECALAHGFEVYLVNPRQLAHYREAVNQRNKTAIPPMPGCSLASSHMKPTSCAPGALRTNRHGTCGYC